MQSLRRRFPPFAVFLLVMFGGAAFATITFLSAQHEVDRAALSHTARPYTGTATDAQKMFLDARIAISQRLFEIAFAGAAALIVLQFSESRRTQFFGYASFSAFGLLVASIYSALLFQLGVSRCLEASMDDLFGPILTYPLLCQFWLLLAAVVFTAASLFRKTGRRIAATALLATLIPAASTVAKSSPYAPCVASWASQHALIVPAEGVRDGARVVELLVARQKLEVDAKDRCTVATTMLDAVRFAAIQDGKPAEGKEGGQAIAILLCAAREAAEKPNLSPSELIGELASIAEVWSVPSGIVDIDAPKTLFVTIVERAAAPRQWKAYTRCVLRLPPGRYFVRASLGNRTVYRRTIDVANRARIPIDILVTP